MVPTPPSTTSSSVGARSPNTDYRVVRKRNRIPLSCGPCRHRKLKCNRSNPCENCIKRGDASSCSYAAPTSRRRNQSSPGSSNSDEMQNRIDRLEGLVLSLMTNGPQSAGPTAANAALADGGGGGGGGPGLMDGPSAGAQDDDGMARDDSAGEESDVDRVTNSLGIMKVEANKSMYLGGSHWASVLSEIAEVKTYFMEHKKQYDEQLRKVAAAKEDESKTGPGFLFNTAAPPSREELLAALPPRPVVDQIVSRYFNSNDPALHIFHGPTFQKDYEAHWQHPSSTPMPWLGQLFAIMCQAMQSYHRAGDEPPEYQGRSMQIANAYRNRSVECLVLSDFCRPTAPMIETLILHLQAEHARTAEVGTWIMGGLIIRLALRMGYHRDPGSFTDITPFEGELRRRVWTFVRMVDVLSSFQMGLPSMLRSTDCDTALPRNLYDEEIDQSTTVLPPSRPITEPTPVSYMIAKGRVAFVFGDIVERINSLNTMPYEDVMKLDGQLREARAAIPLHLRHRPMDECRMDPASLIVQRFSLELLYHKSQCVLHRAFVGRGRTNSRCAHSRGTCIDSCIELMRHQAVLHQETHPSGNGRLRSVKWFAISLTSGDFLLAAVIVIVELNRSFEREAQGRASDDLCPWGAERHAEMIQALKTSNAIWMELRDQSIEAYKANTILTRLLEKLQKTHPTRGAMVSTGPPAAFLFPPPVPNRQAAQSTYGGRTDPDRPEHSAAMTLELLSSGGVNPGSAVGGQQSGDRAFADGLPSVNDTTGLPAATYGPDLAGGGGTVPYSSPPGGDPIATMFTTLGHHGNMLDMPTNFDWDAWDSYIQGTTLDPANNQLWGLNIDTPMPSSIAIDPQLDSRQPQQQSQQQIPSLNASDLKSSQQSSSSSNSALPGSSAAARLQQQALQAQQAEGYPSIGSIFMSGS
ncbi:MAG: hypothetical protein M1823_005329 [Watsoniomyces obsoletus]|nr:MAG: hypothetical protein M1823_005329 [Watsoniomyces obsoletus]